MSRIAVVGLQHQGVILAAGFASVGHEVVGIDDDWREYLDFSMSKEAGKLRRIPLNQ